MKDSTLQRSSTFKKHFNSYRSQSQIRPSKCLERTRHVALIPSVTNALSILLFCRNQSFNANASLNSLILQTEKSKEMCIGWFNALHWCLSHTSMQQKQSALGKDYLSPVQQRKDRQSYDWQNRLCFM